MSKATIPDPPPFVILALTPDQIRLLAVYPRVPRVQGTADVRVWARMASLPLVRARENIRALTEMGAVLPNGDLHSHVRGYLVKLARDRMA